MYNCIFSIIHNYNYLPRSAPASTVNNVNRVRRPRELYGRNKADTRFCLSVDKSNVFGHLRARVIFRASWPLFAKEPNPRAATAARPEAFIFAPRF